MRTNKASFFFDMVTCVFSTEQTYGYSEAVVALENEIRTLTGDRDGFTPQNYAAVVKATVALEFNWSPDTPDDFKALETWWGMRQRGESEANCWKFFAANVNLSILQGGITESDTRAKRLGLRPFSDWVDAHQRARKIWQPEEWKLEEELTPEQRADPN